MAQADTPDGVIKAFGEILITLLPKVTTVFGFVYEDNLEPAAQLAVTVSRNPNDDRPQLGALISQLADAIPTALLNNSAQHLAIEMTAQSPGDTVNITLFPLPTTEETQRWVVAIELAPNAVISQDEQRDVESVCLLIGVLLDKVGQRQRLRDYATFDHLTGLLNRRALAEILEREHVRSERHNRRYGVLFFDLDLFKSINTQFGHAIGDQALQHVARVASRVLREGDWLGRWGGEEFLCILPDAHDAEAEQVAQRLRDQINSQPLIINNQTIPITLSIGVACFPQDGLDINTLLVHADAGLADAKRSGRNTVRRYTPRIA